MTKTKQIKGENKINLKSLSKKKRFMYIFEDYLFMISLMSIPIIGSTLMRILLK